jgi:hypothetical protein
MLVKIRMTDLSKGIPSARYGSHTARTFHLKVEKLPLKVSSIREDIESISRRVDAIRQVERIRPPRSTLP